MKSPVAIAKRESTLYKMLSAVALAGVLNFGVQATDLATFTTPDAINSNPETQGWIAEEILPSIFRGLSP